MSGKARRIRRAILPLLLLLGGVAIALSIVGLSQEAERKETNPAAPLVEVVAMKAQSAPLHVTGTGTVAAEQEVTLIPEVAGKVVWVSRKLRPGGRVRKGETLLRLDARQYKLALEQEKSRVRSAQLDLELEEGRRDVAKQAWKILGEGNSEEARLATRKSQLENARSQVKSSKSGLENAQLNIDRSTIRAPFDAMVISEQVDVGQYVSSQSQIAELVGTSAMRVAVSVTLDELSELEVPGINSKKKVGSSVAIRQELRNGKSIAREGHVTGLVGRLDAQTRRAELLVLVDQPVDPALGLPLLPGAFVDVDISGTALTDTFEVPRTALKERKSVWTVTKESQLQSQAVNVRWSDDRSVFVDADFPPGTLVMTSELSAPVDGLTVQARRTRAGKDAN